jgi:hypothetical protein
VTGTDQVTVQYESFNDKVPVRLTLPKAPSRILGNVFRFSGMGEYGISADRVDFSTRPAWIEVSLEKTGASEDYEAKIAYTYVDKRGKLPLGSLFELPILQVKGVYLPLRVARTVSPAESQRSRLSVL